MQGPGKKKVSQFAYEVEQMLERLLGKNLCSWDYLCDSERLFWELAVEEVMARPLMTAKDSYAGKRSVSYLLGVDSLDKEWEDLSPSEKSKEELFLSAVKAALSLNQESCHG